MGRAVNYKALYRIRGELCEPDSLDALDLGPFDPWIETRGVQALPL